MGTVIHQLPRLRTSLRRGLPGLALMLSVWAPAAVAAPDTAPRLISTTGGAGAQTWDSLKALEKAAAAGNPEACLQLGVRYERGDDVKRDDAHARKLYARAAAGGNAMAIYRLGRFWLNGVGGDRDPAMAAKCFHIAALANVAVAQYNLGAMLVSARGVPRDFIDGLAWLIVATHNGFAAQGEQQVRHHLADEPQVITAAENRAKVFQREIKAHHGTRPQWPPRDETEADVPENVPPPPVEKPSFAPPALAPSDLAPPKAAPLPPPTFSPPTLPPPSLPDTPKAAPKTKS